MAKIRADRTSTGPAVPAEKDLQAARQQAERKAGEALIRAMSERARAQQEKNRSDDKDDKSTKDEEPKDTAELSRTHEHAHTDRTSDTDEILRWILEMAGKDWEAFLEWQPDLGLPLPDQLQQLSKLYLCLLEAVLTHTDGAEQAEQTERLDRMLAQKLDLVMDQELEHLLSLLEETGEDAVLDGIRASLYRQTAGRTLSPRAAHDLFLQASLIQHRSSRSAGRSSSFSGEGMIYQASRKQDAQFQKLYRTQQDSWKEQSRQRNETIRNARNGIAENSFRQAGPSSCSGKELELADRFAVHLCGDKDLFHTPGINARNEELLGLLAAVMSIKGYVYAEKTGQTSALAHTLQNAIAKLIDQYLGRNKGMNVYTYTLTAYRQMKDPQRAIQNGQDYAYQCFREKQKDPVCQRSSPYSADAGFFRALLKKLSPEKEFALGCGILQENWKDFLDMFRASRDPFSFSGIDRHSPWGSLAGTRTQHIGMEKNTARLLLGAIAVFITGFLIVFWYRFM